MFGESRVSINDPELISAYEKLWDLAREGDELAHVEHLPQIAFHDLAVLAQKEAEYRGSWKRRGGVKAFANLERKWDRLTAQVERHGGDVIAAIELDQREEGVLDDLRDLRRYLLLVESEIMRRRRDRQSS